MPFGVKINGWNTGDGRAAENYISFELYAVTKSVSQPFYMSPYGAGTISVQQTGTALNLIPDVSDTAFWGPYGSSGLSTPGVAEGNNIGQVVGNGDTDWSNSIYAGAVGFVYPSSASPNSQNLLTTGSTNQYSATPLSNIQLPVSGGTLGMVKIADLFYTYTKTQEASMGGCRDAAGRRVYVNGLWIPIGGLVSGLHRVA